MTILSCDNLPGNGDAARNVLLGAADGVAAGLAAWIDDHCSFPNSMVDRITPVTSDDDRAALLERDGIVDRWPVVAEPFRQWVLEDEFVAGRPAWEHVGALFTDDVHAWELYKLRILNAGHSCIAYLCALAGITYVDEAMATPEVRGFVGRLLAEEAVPALAPIPGYPPDEYAAPSSVASLTRASVTRSPGCASTAPPSSRRSSCRRSNITSQLADRSVTPPSPWPAGPVTLRSSRAISSLRTVGEPARRIARAALHDPTRFLELDAVFTAALRESEHFRTEFAAAPASWRPVDRSGRWLRFLSGRRASLSR